MLEPVAPHASFGLELDSLPSEYDFLASEVRADSAAFKKVEEKIAASLPEFRLVGLRRFANQKLWRAYVAQRDEVAKGNSNDPNVKLLFHGTKEPQLILGTGFETNSEGFDFRRSAAGQYGVGSYFATAAAYPVKIHPRRSNPDGTFTLVLAEVACGAVQNMGEDTDKSIRVPKERRPGLLYDSVCGTEHSIGPKYGLDLAHGEQYVVYQHSQAYPHFVCTIQPLPLQEPAVLVGKIIRLRSVHYGDTPDPKYLYAPAIDHSERRGQVLCWKGKATNDVLSKARWKVEAVKGQAHQVRLASVHFGDGAEPQYLYTPEIDYNKERGQVLLWRGSPSADSLSKACFRVEAVEGQHDQVRLSSVHFGTAEQPRYVYTPAIDHNAGRGEILVWKSPVTSDVLSKARFAVEIVV